MNEQTFVDTVGQRVEDLGRTYGLNEDKAFLVWAATVLWGMEEEEAAEAIVDSPNDKSVDLFWYDDGGERIVIAQAKYTRGKRGPRLKDLSAFPACLGWLSKPEALEQEGVLDLADAARQFVELRQRDLPVDLWFIHFSAEDMNLAKEAEIFNQVSRNKAERIQLRVVSRETLRGAFQDLEEASERVDKDAVPFTWIQQQEGRYGPALVATVKGRHLAELYKRHGNRLFVRNIRLYLGERKESINRRMAETLQDAVERGNFWAYNNGITLVCHKFKANRRKRLLELESFSIVNGCQTTVSLSRADEPGEDVEVLVKVLNPSNEVIDRIIEFTNSQNEIRPWDIKSQDRVQRRLREDLQALSRPYFYVIRKGEFEALPASEKREYRSNGQRRAIQFDALAQYLGAFRGAAYYAYKFKARLFENLYREVFPEDIDAKYVLFVWQLGEMVREFTRERIAHAAQEGKHDTVRILKKGARIYLLSVVEALLRLRNGDTYITRVADGTTFGASRAQRLRKYLEWALDWYTDAVVRLTDNDRADINTLVRQEDFIKRVNEHVAREFQRLQRAPKFFEEALPTLVTKTRRARS